MAAIFRISALWGVMLVVSEYAWAFASGGNEMGNGGHVVECTGDDGSTTWEVLDVYETKRDVRGWKVRLAELPGTYIEKAQQALARLDPVDPQRAKLYQTVLRAFAEHVVFVPQWPRETDAPYDVEDHCVLHLAAGQKLSREFDNTLFINKAIWDKLDEDNKAALLIHEVVYWDTLRHGHILSWVARGLSSFILADELKSIEATSFQTLMYQFAMTPNRWHDERSGKIYEIQDRLFSDVEEAAQACARRGLAILPYDLATSSSFQRFMESYPGKRAAHGTLSRPIPVITGHGQHVFMSYDARTRRMTPAKRDGLFPAVCTMNSYF